MKPQPPPVGAQRGQVLPSLFAGLFGAFLGLSLLKFGNPPITEKWVTAPAQFYEFLFCYPWPIAWAYGLLAVVAVAGIAVARWKSPAPWWLLALPLVWLVWQFLAATQSADPALTQLTLKHFAACAVCFYLGYFSLSRVQRHWPFWIGLLGGFLLVMVAGWGQRFGGLEQSRRYFFLYVYPQLKEVFPDYLKKIHSDRIFATLFYPNTLAGALLLLLPVTLAGLWQLRAFLTPAARWLLMFLVGLVGTAGLACLYWSGSKGGWLLMLVLGLAGLLRLPFSQRLKITLVTGVLLAGLAGFFWKHSAFFQKGATSVSARFDYWCAAAQTAQTQPLFGTGPGTFAIAYQKLKRPESEMARLTHNDYLQQASDSGLVGFLAYTLFILGALAWGFPQAGTTAGGRARHSVRAADTEDRSGLGDCRVGAGAHGVTRPTVAGDHSAAVSCGAPDWLVFAVWLGVLGWGLQSLVEFGLYIPALAWPAFTFLGWLLGRKTPTLPQPPPSNP